MTPSNPEPLRTVVPETRGTLLLEFVLDDDGQVLIGNRLPVIAWRISCVEPDTFVTPICPEPFECDNTTWCLELQQTPPVWLFPEDAACKSLDQAVSVAAKQLKQRAEIARRAKQKQATAPSRVPTV